MAPIYGAFNPSGEWPSTTPPMFLAVAGDDSLAMQAELDAFNALRAAHYPTELHVFEKGGHGFGMVILGVTTDGWFDEFLEWLAAQGLTSP